MNKTVHTLHTAKITNNCPICYANNGLEFSFSQVELENDYYKKADKKVLETLFCSTCNQEIYPINWTDNIEGVYQYNRKLAIAIKSGIRLKKRGVVILISIGILLAATIYFLGKA